MKNSNKKNDDDDDDDNDYDGDDDDDKRIFSGSTEWPSASVSRSN